MGKGLSDENDYDYAYRMPIVRGAMVIHIVALFSCIGPHFYQKKMSEVLVTPEYGPKILFPLYKNYAGAIRPLCQKYYVYMHLWFYAIL